jgi:acetylornithine deacetylase/succinyl-diaminopimelate desuccinylase-like protein
VTASAINIWVVTLGTVCLSFIAASHLIIFVPDLAPEVECVADGPGMLPSKTPLTSPHAEPIRRAIVAARGVEPLIYPAGFGSLPGYAFTKTLGIHAFVVPYGNADAANHAPNENLTLECFFNGIRTGAALLDEIGRQKCSNLAFSSRADARS